MKCATEPNISPVISILPLATSSNGGQMIAKELRVHKPFIVKQCSVYKVVAWIAYFHQHKLCLICYD